MKGFRPYFFSHALYFLLLFGLVGGVGWRIAWHNQRLGALQDSRGRLVSLLRELDTVHRLISRLPLGSSGVISSVEFRENLQRLQQTLRRLKKQFPALADQPSFLPMISQVDEAQRRFSGAVAPPFPDPDLLRRTLGGVPLLWSNLVREFGRRQERLDADIFNEAKLIYQEAGLGLLILLLISFVYFFLVIVLLDWPIRRLGGTAREVTSGELRTRAEPRGARPVRELTEDFNEMVNILVQSLYEEEQVIGELKRKARELEAANRHKNHFLANVSHELKTPLNAIIGFADILSTGRHGPLTERQQDYMRRIFSAGEHLLEMISDLIDIAKIDLDAMQLENQSCKVDEHVREASSLLEPRIREKELDFRLDLPEVPLEAVLDARRLRQIVINLLTNAVKFTPENGTIVLRLQRQEKNLKLEVQDSGPGIPGTEQERIFEDFVQLEDHLHRQHEGTGIGLPLCRRLCQLMGGRLQVKSKPGQGSLFILTLPLMPPAPALESTETHGHDKKS